MTGVGGTLLVCASVVLKNPLEGISMLRSSGRLDK